MPRYRNQITFEIARNLKAFLRLDAGLTRGETPDPERQLHRAEARIKQQARRIEQLRQISGGEQKEPLGHKDHPLKESSGAASVERPGPLKIVHVSTQDAMGGAARAAQRLHHGLLRLGHDSSMFVARRHGDDPSVRVFEPSQDAESVARRERRGAMIEDDFSRYEESRPEVYRIGDSFNDDRSPFGGGPLEQLPPCDVVNLHVISGFIDHQAFFGSVPGHTPVVWTLHDMNSFTGGCHYDYGCGKHAESCGACPQLGSDDEEDLSRQSWRRKREVYSQVAKDRLHVVGASRWLADEARRSSLFDGFPVTTIPYSLDTQAFAPRDHGQARATLGVPEDARVALFLTDSLVTRRKGFALLAEALNGIKDVPNLRLLSLGYNDPSLLKNPPIVESIPHQHFDFLDDDLLLSSIYSAADLFVIPSLQENLPQTALEAMSCGTPVVGFDVGGIPDLVRPGVTGELAPVGDAEALGSVIRDLLKDPEKLAALSDNCRRVVIEEYNHDLQAGRYADLYRALLKARAG
ncbi:MAG: glycosyltransferase family 4 protein [Rubrobacteraceae bacterium]